MESVALATDAADAPLLPLTPDSWLSLPAGATVRALTTAQVLAAGALPAALDRFHALAVDVLPMALRLAAVDELNRLRARAAKNQRAGELAVDALSGVLGGDPLRAALPVVRAAAGSGAGPSGRSARLRGAPAGPAG